MLPKEKAESLINQYRILLMSEDTECGNEILCTEIAKKCALVFVNEILSMSELILLCNDLTSYWDYWKAVRKEILSY